MPSDARVLAALDAVRRRIDSYRSFVAVTRERLRASLAGNGGAQRARQELGAFGARIDAARFAELRHDLVLDPLSRSRLERADAVLGALASAGDESFVCEVASGDSLRVAVAHAFARLGQAFSAAAVTELVRTGRFEPERHDRVLDAYPLEWWSASERDHAPPLVVVVDGADLRACSLADLVDGHVQIVLLVRGAAAAAPLVCLTTPGTLVLQTQDSAALGVLSAFDGPAVAALFEQDVAHFTHHPSGGGAPWQRTTIAHLPAAPRKRVAGISARQQRQELLQLQALAERPALPNGPIEAVIPPGAGDAADRLTAWLLAESGLAGTRADGAA